MFIHPADALMQGIADHALVRLRSVRGTGMFRAVVSTNQRRGELFVPIHWSGATSSAGLVGALIAPSVDPHSKQPEFKITPVQMEVVSFNLHGIYIGPTRPDCLHFDYWTCTAIKGGVLVDFATSQNTCNLRSVMNSGNAVSEVCSSDGTLLRMADIHQGSLKACLFASKTMTRQPRQWLWHVYDSQSLITVPEILSGRALAQEFDASPVVCSCFNISEQRIATCIDGAPDITVEAVGVALNAGTNCGSCRPNIARMIKEAHHVETV